MSRFSILEWVELNQNEWFTMSGGSVELRCTHEVGYVVRQDGVEACLGGGFCQKAVINGPFEVSFVGPKEAKCYVKVPWQDAFGPTGRVFTNPDRMLEGSSMDAVTKALKLLKLETAEKTARARGITKALIKALEPDAAPGPEKVQEPDAKPAKSKSAATKAETAEAAEDAE